MMFLYTLIEKQGFLANQHVTNVQLSDSTPKSIMSLSKPPVAKADHPPSKKTTINSQSKMISLTLMVQGYKGEIVTERSVTMGTLAETNNQISSQPMSHSSSSQKDADLSKGQVISVGDNTPIAGITSLAKDPSYLLSITTPAVNVILQSQRVIQAESSVFNDPSVKTQAGDDEETNSVSHNGHMFTTAFSDIIKGEKFIKEEVADANRRMLIYFMLSSRGRKRANECKNQWCSYEKLLVIGNRLFDFYHKVYIFTTHVEKLLMLLELYRKVADAIWKNC